MARKPSGPRAPKKKKGKPRNPKGTCPPAIKPYCFKKGQSGNLRGRPPGHVSFAKYVRKRMAENDVTDPDATKAEAIVNVAFDQALQGDARARAFIVERADGPVTQSVRIIRGVEDLTQEERRAVIRSVFPDAEALTAALAEEVAAGENGNGASNGDGNGHAG